MIDLESVTLKCIPATVYQLKHGGNMIAFELILVLCPRLVIPYKTEQIFNDKKLEDSPHALQKIIFFAFGILKH
jgi:hypothetical protein